MPTDTADLPIACQRDAAVDTNALFRELRDRWLAAKPNRIGTDLCKFLDTRKQLVSCYATGSDGRRPPLCVLMRLVDDLRLELRFTADGVVLTKRARGSRGPDGPGTKAGDVVVPWVTLVDRLI
jgi:hypothetical protein